MRHLLLLSVFFFFLSQSKALDASVTLASFRAEATSFVEVYIQIVGKTVNFQQSETGGMQAAVNAELFIYRGDSLVTGERFLIRSPEFRKINDFIDIHRYALPAGQYMLQMSFSDAENGDNNLEVRQDFQIENPTKGLGQSDIRLLSSCAQDDRETPFHRNGYFMEPLPFNYYHRFNSTLIFYNEIYNAESALDNDFMVTYKIQKKQTASTFEDLDFRHMRVSPQKVNPILAKLDISALPSGNYLLRVEVKDREQALLSARTIEFSRSNPMADIKMIETEEDNGMTWLDTVSMARIEYAMKALEPTLSGQDVETLNYLLSKGKPQYKRNFLYHIWSDRYGDLAEQAYYQYMEVADAINSMFKSGMGYGFETDRGRMYLKYGRPYERIRIEDDQGAFPYEIWYYSRIEETGQTDVRFMFYNPDLATNHFILLTSTCRGEKRNSRWEMLLYRNAGQNPTDNIVDATQVPDSYRRRARQLYEN